MPESTALGASTALFTGRFNGRTCSVLRGHV
jgi:hypothetical protein